MMKWNSMISMVAVSVVAVLISQTRSLAADGVPAPLPTEIESAEQARVETISKIAPSVVAIFAAGGKGGGSGVLISAEGWAITNFHVVQGSGPFMQCGLNDGKIYDAVLVGIDPTGDVAIIKLLGRNDFPFAEIGDSDTVRIGDMTFALGNPFLLATDFQPTVTYGMVSGTHRYQYPAGTFLEYTDCIQVDTSINPGNSGGPLFNAAGELIGINGRISVEKRGRVNVGAGYSISINQVMNFLDHLKSGRIVDHATLGATVFSNSDGSVMVRSVLESSEAFRRGLRSGDELLTFAGRPLRSVNQFKNILGIYPKGWSIPLSYHRDGEQFDVSVRLMPLHRDAELAPNEPEPEAEKPKLPIPIPIPGLNKDKGPKIPEKYKHLYEKKHGYANYRFNRTKQEEFLKRIESFGKFPEQKSGWAFSGLSAANVPFQVRIQSDAIASKWGEDFAVQDLSKELNSEPPGSGGLFIAMQQCKEMFTDPAEYFTDFYYLGSEPLDGTGARVDVLITSRGLVNSRWYFDRLSHDLVGFDTTLEEGLDPCEIRFGKRALEGDLRLPSHWMVRHGGADFADIVIESLQTYDPKVAP